MRQGSQHESSEQKREVRNVCFIGAAIGAITRCHGELEVVGWWRNF
jgi:hypothetical protein